MEESVLMKYRRFFTAAVFLVLVSCQAVVEATMTRKHTVEEVYPGLAAGILKSAGLVPLEKGVLLRIEGIQIETVEMEQMVKKSKPEEREALLKNLLYVLEKTATRRLLLYEAHKAGYNENDPEDQVVRSFLHEKLSGVSVPEEEARTFYEQNKENMGSAPFEYVKSAIESYLLEQKREEAMEDYIQKLGEVSDIEIDAEWTKEQSVRARDNPVDRARMSGKPTIVEFGAAGCKPCDMMQPILSNLREKYSDKLNVLFVHVKEQEVLAARYGIRLIPVQVFFDSSGQEVFRHVGFYPQVEIENKLAGIGL